jgi:predicted MFS family arabinose efflux permease
LRVLYGLVLLSGVLATYYLPMRYAMLPTLVPANQLVQANTILTTSLAVLAVGGMPLGGWLAWRTGPMFAIGLNALAYAVSIMLLRRIKMPTATEAKPVGDNLREGINYIRSHPTVIPFMLIAAAFAFLAGILIVTIIGYAQQTLHLTTIGLGWLGGVAGIGAALGILLIGRAKAWTRSIWLPPVQLVAGGVAIWMLSQVQNPWLAAPLILLIGAVGATSIIPIDVKLQEQVSEARRGAVFAARGMFTSATMLVAFWMKFGTSVLRTTPPPTVLMWCGAGAVLVAAGTAWVLRRRVAAASA